MTTAAIYARVSSARQREEQTIGSQTAALIEAAERWGLEVPAEWIFEDEGYSGATLIRPALERLRDLAAQVPVDVVLCYSPDRLARRYAYQALLIDEFGRAGTEVRFVKGPRADTPEDELMIQFQGMIAEYERAQIAERTRRGKAHRARAGLTNVLGGAPYGYRYVRRSESADARYEIVEDEARIVRELFRRYIEDQVAMADLVRWLAEEGIPTSTGKARWDRSTIWGMLRNPAYVGRAAFLKTMRTDERAGLNRTARRQGRAVSNHASRPRPREDWIEIPVPAIVSTETFEAAARRLEDNRRFATRNTKVPSLLMGLVVCEGCGYAYYRTSTRTKTRKLYYYRCLGSDDYRYENGRVCDNRPVRADFLDEVVWGQVTALLVDPALVQAELDRRLAELRSANPATAERSRIELELTRTTAAVTRLVEAYQEDLLSLDELRARMPALRAKETSLRASAEALDAQLLDRDAYLKLAEDLEGFLARLRETSQDATVEDRQRVLRTVVKEVVVGPERVVVRHSIPTSARPEGSPGYPFRLRCHRHPLRACPLSDQSSSSKGRRRTARRPRSRSRRWWAPSWTASRASVRASRSPQSMVPVRFQSPGSTPSRTLASRAQAAWSAASTCSRSCSA
jgi:site-specific DNA recombinase